MKSIFVLLLSFLGCSWVESCVSLGWIGYWKRGWNKADFTGCCCITSTIRCVSQLGFLICWLSMFGCLDFAIMTHRRRSKVFVPRQTKKKLHIEVECNFPSGRIMVMMSHRTNAYVIYALWRCDWWSLISWLNEARLFGGIKRGGQGGSNRVCGEIIALPLTFALFLCCDFMRWACRGHPALHITYTPILPSRLHVGGRRVWRTYNRAQHLDA